MRHAAATHTHTPTSLGPLGKTHSASVRQTGGLSLEADRIYIQTERWQSPGKPVVTDKPPRSLLRLPDMFVFSCRFQGDQAVNKT